MDDEKNLHPGGRKFIGYFNRFSGDILFSSLVSFDFFYSCFFVVVVAVVVCLFFQLKNVYSDTHRTLRAGE